MTAMARQRGGSVVACLAAVALTATVAGTAIAQSAAPAASKMAASPAAVGFDSLKGTWVRPDGGYRIVIGKIGADGRIEASYTTRASSLSRRHRHR